MHGYENSLVFSNFQLVLFSTVHVQFTGLWPILLRSTSLSALSAAQNLRFPWQFRLSADALEEKSVPRQSVVCVCECVVCVWNQAQEVQCHLGEWIVRGSRACVDERERWCVSEWE